ncbi:MAG: hypothetical protein SCM11_16820, partial [Bacillota bacterium]|nr:hypothetical protein [Bacillota bacterium]
MTQTVMVIFGGVSTEYIVSLRSAFNIIGGLRAVGYKVVPVGITPDGSWLRHDGADEAILRDQWREEALAVAAGRSAEAEPVRSPRDFILSVCGCAP